MSVLKLQPSFKDYIWGGNRLKSEYNKNYNGDVLAEAWELSCHKDGPSFITNGEHKGKTLQEFLDQTGKSSLGSNCADFEEFPILVKLIDAKDDLSIQVHPDNNYALKNENQYGKTEMWYVVDCEENAFLYYGFSKEIDKAEFAKRIEENTLTEVLNAVPVQKGDVFFIEAGTIHAIGKEIVIAEIQQNSNVTYRVYDYGRVGVDGKPRDLHIEKAVDVTKREVLGRNKNATPHLADCEYFTVDKLYLDGKNINRIEGKRSTATFIHFLFLDGNGTISSCGETVSFTKGDSIFLTAENGNYVLDGKCEALLTTIDKKI